MSRKKPLSFDPLKIVDAELKRRSMAETAFCKSIGLQDNAISKLRRRDDPSVMSVQTLMKLANGLGVHPSVFFDGAATAPDEQPVDIARRLLRAIERSGE